MASIFYFFPCKFIILFKTEKTKRKEEESDFLNLFLLALYG